jgi:hypothetical protein
LNLSHSGSYDQTGQYQMDQYQHGGYNMPSYNAGYGSQYGSNGGGQSMYPSQQSEYDHTASGHYQDYK